jgi:hypothetical protein
MRLGQRAPQTIRIFRNQDQVNVIGHQAPCQAMHVALAAGCRHQLDICGIILVPEEYRLPPVASLGHVMRNPGNTMRASLAIPAIYGSRAFGN